MLSVIYMRLFYVIEVEHVDVEAKRVYSRFRFQTWDTDAI